MRGWAGAGWTALALCALLAAAGTALAQAPPGKPVPPPAAPPAGQAAPGAPPVGQTARAAPDAAPEAAAPAEAPETPPAAPLPEAGQPQVIDVPGDDGTALGVLWRWIGSPSDTLQVTIQAKADPAWLDAYRLSPADEQRLKDAAAVKQQGLDALAPQRAAAAQKLADAQTAVQTATATHSGQAQAAQQLWTAKAAVQALDQQAGRIEDAFTAKTGKLGEKAKQYEYLSAALDAAQAGGGWIDTDVSGSAADLAATKNDAKNRFGAKPADADKLYQEVKGLQLPVPAALAQAKTDPYGQRVGPVVLPLTPGQQYTLQMALSDGGAPQATPLGSAAPRVNWFIGTALNNFLVATVFTVIILIAIALARRNPNLFIRRIAGLEAVDEAIGRATEMGKPVLYLNGRTGLDDLATLAAVNILGRVARRVAAFDSNLQVPCSDPVVLSVAQEIVREGFIDAGRPDAYREDSVFFVTADQFAYTAAVCAMMIRDRPAANFFMGNYAAESLLLAETGASTGAIQIAGTDQQSQLPFFITACDYTLIGEELYAASAYLSREPLLLGSLKGQDLGKAVMLLFMLVQAALLAVNHNWTWLIDAARPLF